MITLREIDETNYERCFRLDAGAADDSFVDSVVYALAEAWVFYRDTKPFAIYAQDRPVGFVSMYVGEDNPQIVNFFVDRAYQNRGYGTQAARLCLRFLQREHRARRVSVPVRTGNAAAQRFWGRLGFAPSDSVEDGYMFMRRELPSAAFCP